jgi:hypothetical protein
MFTFAVPKLKRLWLAAFLPLWTPRPKGEQNPFPTGYLSCIYLISLIKWVFQSSASEHIIAYDNVSCRG